ncbi:hypothetical protein GALL_526700 [mine drainage metagenome]|uniref:Uncharacterized protein n=1 Tax=mine drainage metagenome TaxID=410659 RepID=A0A1J5P4V6_9ZZZZ
MPQTGSFRSAFNQTRQICHHKTLLRTDPHHPQIRMQGGKRVICDARTSIGDGRDQCRFASVGHTQQTDISQYFEFELQVAFFTRPAGCFLPWRTVDGTFVAQIAKTAITAFGNGDHFTGFKQLKQHLTGFGIGNDGAHRHLQGNVFASRAKHIRAHAMLATLRVVAARKPVIHQRIEVGVGNGKHVTTATTIPAIGTTKLLVFFMPKRNAAGSAVSGRNVNVGFVNEFHDQGFINEKPRAVRRVLRGDYQPVKLPSRSRYACSKHL